jgi:TRAP-type C4-dicarboxylate transport system substrate-binding protein
MNRAMLLFGIIGPLLLLLGAPAPEAPAGESAKPQLTLKLMGINHSVPQYRVWEELGQTVEKRANGRVKFEFTSLPELGLGGAETIRITKTGIVDGCGYFSSMGATGCQWPGGWSRSCSRAI